MPIQNDTISTKLISVGFVHICNFAEDIRKSTFEKCTAKGKYTVSI